MKRFFYLVVLLALGAGCIIEDEHDGRHRHREAARVEVGHVHGPSCGHVLIAGVWYEDR